MKEKIIPPVRPNVGIEIAYRKRLDRLIAEMHNSCVYWLTAAYKANTPEMAQDASPAMALRGVMKALSRRWTKRINDAAPELADYFSKAATERSDAALKSILKNAGFSIEWKMTAQANDVLQATIGEQVSLIKSVASNYLSDVEGAVMRSVAAGRDIKGLIDEIGPKISLTRKLGESDASLIDRTQRRAALIARSQNNLATANMTKARQDSLGMTEAVWMHSHGGRHPRPSHVAADGKRYNIKDGMVLDGKVCWPGTEINCRCLSRGVIPGF